MAEAPIRVTFRLDPSPALVSVLRGSIQFQAAQAGCEASDEIAAASEAVCREVLLQCAEAGAALEVSLDSFEERIEVSVVHPPFNLPSDDNRPAAASKIAGKSGAGNLSPESFAHVDEVTSETEEGIARTKLVKYLKSQK